MYSGLGSFMARRARKKEVLDTGIKSTAVLNFEEVLKRRVVGQDEAVDLMVRTYQKYRAGLVPRERPMSILLFLGPTGTGKTWLVEAAAETIFGSRGALTKIDCAEFQHSHEVAKLVGSPPGYLGHRETPPMLTQETLDEHMTEENQFSFVLFDELEKADHALWQLLLGILDKGTLTLGDNRKVDFSKTIVVLTSNIAAKQIDGMLGDGGIGFTRQDVRGEGAKGETKITEAALGATRAKLPPELINRFDHQVVFNKLTRPHLEKILKLEIQDIQDRILQSDRAPEFVLECTTKAADYLLEKGTSSRYGARHLKRALESLVVSELAVLITTGQVKMGDIITLEMNDDEENPQLVFLRSEQ